MMTSADILPRSWTNISTSCGSPKHKHSRSSIRLTDGSTPVKLEVHRSTGQKVRRSETLVDPKTATPTALYRTTPHYRGIYRTIEG